MTKQHCFMSIAVIQTVNYRARLFVVTRVDCDLALLLSRYSAISYRSISFPDFSEPKRKRTGRKKDERNWVWRWRVSYLLLAARTKSTSDEQRSKHWAKDVVGVAKTDICSGLVSFASKKFHFEFLVNRSEFFWKERHDILNGAPYHIRW